MNIFLVVIIFTCHIFLGKCEETSTDLSSRRCVTLTGVPQMCFPNFENYASYQKSIHSTNTCGMNVRQKYCIGLSTAEMRSRCDYCNAYDPNERHLASFLTDENPNNWWQSETLAHNKQIHYRESINLTLDLESQYHVTFMHLQFKSPRPKAMILYKKFDDESPWEPWQYFASNCKSYFNMPAKKDGQFSKPNEVSCTEDFSSADEFYNGIVVFLSIYGRPGAKNFFQNKELMKWATASQIKIELKKMFTFGDEIAEEELLLTHFYAIKSLQVAGRCWCNGHGNECTRSTGEGVQPKLYCSCHPSHFTTGKNCEKCQNFYQDRPWQPANITDANICKKCQCNGNSESCVFDENLYIKSSNLSGGYCQNCRGNTKGPHCETCEDEYYKDSSNNQPDSVKCVPCNCDVVGSVNGNCDINGKCVCKPGVTGDKCTRCKPDHYNFFSSGCQPCNCNPDGLDPTKTFQCNPVTGVCTCKKNVNGKYCDKCMQGYFSLSKDDPLGCQRCFCFYHTKDCKMSQGFLVDSIESKFNLTVDDWMYISNDGKKYNPMLNLGNFYPSITWFKDRDPWKETYFLLAPKKFLGNKRLSYNLNLELHLSFEYRPNYQNLIYQRLRTTSIDVQLIGDTFTVSVPFNVPPNSEPQVDGKIHIYKFKINEESVPWRDNLDTFRFISILTNLTGIKIRLTNSEGYIKLHKVSLQIAVSSHADTSKPAKQLSQATSVEECKCPKEYTGLSCENCAPGYHRDASNGQSTSFVKCIPCSCNNQTDSCDVNTGKCDCQHNSVGKNCESCAVGYYGDTSTLIRGICKPCLCPGGGACKLLKMVTGDQVVCTDCPNNLGGYRCERCQDNFYGDPMNKIDCKPCNCHGNIDYFSSCNYNTGKCSNCLFNSAGDYCETCIPGFYLLANETGSNRCQNCQCNPKGSRKAGMNCNVKNGNCDCRPLVTGKKCDSCIPQYFNLNLNQNAPACEKCKCFLLGSVNDSCDLQTGQCNCKPGVTGLKCDRCQSSYFNQTLNGCQPCNCVSIGSISMDCNQVTGKCKCKPNVIGDKCDMCKENYQNLAENCTECSACYKIVQAQVNIIRQQLNDISANISTKQSSNPDALNDPLIKNIIDTYRKMIVNLISNSVEIQKDLENYKTSLDTANALSENITNDNSRNKVQMQTKALKYYLNQLHEFAESSVNELKIELEKLKDYVNLHNMSNANLTNLFKTVQQLEENMKITFKEYMEKIAKANKDTFNITNEIVDFRGNFDRFINRTNKLQTQNNTEDIKKMKTVTLDSIFLKLGLHKTLLSFEKLQENLLTLKNRNISQEYQLTFSKLKTLKITYEELEKKIQEINRKYEAVDQLIKSGKLQNNDLVKLKIMIQSLYDKQKEIDQAIIKAEAQLKELEDFNEVVSKTKFEAEENVKKLPKLNIDYEQLNQSVKTLEKTTKSILEDMDKVIKGSKSNKQSVEKLIDNFKSLLNYSKILEENSQKMLEFAKSVLQQLNQKNEKLKQLQLDQDALSDQLNRITKVYNDQVAFNSKLDREIKELFSKINSMKDNTDSPDKKILDEFDRKIIELSNLFNQLIVTKINNNNKQMKSLDEDWSSLENESTYLDMELKRLENIDSKMLGTEECYKTGGSAEGGTR